MTIIYYVYPIWHRTSFSIIAREHIKQLKKYFKVYEIDELVLPTITPYIKPLLILHPYFYMAVKYAKRFERLLSRSEGIIGVDVADSDRLTVQAVNMTHYTEAMIVPSSFARDVYIKSGVRRPVYVVPHGLDDTYFTRKGSVSFFNHVWNMKRNRKLILLLFFCWHSDYRKGLDLVLKVYRKLRKMRKDIVLIIKTMGRNTRLEKLLKLYDGLLIWGWLTENQKIELYDICDIYLGFSRGGGFELNYLEALVRGEVVVAPNKGSWVDYLPEFSLVECHNCPYVLKNNPIHCGKGFEIDIDSAVKKILDIADNLSEYKSRVREYVESRVKKEYTWKSVGLKLKSILEKYI